MHASHFLNRHRRLARRLRLAPVAAVLLAAGTAQAQTSAACEQFKGVLAKRITGSFTLEDVAADEPVPAGAKVVATCEAGARKILLIRPGREGTPAASASASAVTPPPTAAAPVTAASAPAPRARPTELRAATPPPAAERVQASPPVVVELPRPAESAPAPTLSPSRDEATIAGSPLRERATAWLGQRWPWLLVPLLVLLALVAWAWQSHRSAYDEAGLPRGPRLN